MGVPYGTSREDWITDLRSEAIREARESRDSDISESSATRNRSITEILRLDRQGAKACREAHQQDNSNGNDNNNGNDGNNNNQGPPVILVDNSHNQPSGTVTATQVNSGSSGSGGGSGNNCETITHENGSREFVCHETGAGG